MHCALETLVTMHSTSYSTFVICHYLSQSINQNLVTARPNSVINGEKCVIPCQKLRSSVGIVSCVGIRAEMLHYVGGAKLPLSTGASSTRRLSTHSS